MIRWKQLRESLQNILEDDSADTLADLVSWVNLALDSLGSQYPWPTLYRENTVTPDANGMFYLPGLAKEFVRIYDANKTYTFVDKGPNRSSEIPRLNEYSFYRQGVKLTEGTLYNCSLTANSGTVLVSAGGMTANVTAGQSVAFSGLDGFFEVITVNSDTSITVFPVIPYLPDSQVMEHLPLGLEQIYVENATGLVYTSNVIVGYQMRHPYIDNDDSRIIVPCTMSLFYRTLQLAALNAKYTNDTVVLQRMFDDAYETEVQNCTSNKRRLNMEPVAQLGHAFGLSTSRRGSRGINASY